MTSTPKKSTEAEDVLEFLNSLPENSKKTGDNGGAFKAKANRNVKDGNDNDILEFLDELEKSDIKKKDVKKDNFEQKKTSEPAKVEEPKPKAEEVNTDSNKQQDNQEEVTKEATQEEEEENFIDPITSISNWWSSSGSQTVNSFWNNAVTITNKAGEEATKFAQIEEIESKIKSLNLDKEAKKLIDSSRNVVGKDPLKVLSTNLTNVLNSLNHIDEILTIYLIHDLVNFQNLNDIISSNFKKVLSQVQGSISIKVIKQNTANPQTETENFKKFNLFEGKSIDGEKLAYVNLESSVQSVTKAQGSKEEGDNKEKDEEEQNQHQEASVSNIFVSILPIRQTSNKSNESSSDDVETIDQNSDSSFSFTIILKDITHDITIVSRSQPFPTKWVQWLEGDIKDKNQTDKEQEEQEKEQDSDSEEVDPSEWVKEWIDDGLALTIGVLAQSYVVKRMGY